MNSNNYKVVMLGDRYRVVSKQKYGDFNFNLILSWSKMKVLCLVV